MSSVRPHEVLPLPPSSDDLQAIPGSPPLPVAGAQSELAIPALEPPAPISARVHSRAARSRWWLERWWEVPSWMTSLVLHLAITIVVASLAVKAGPRRSVMITLDATISEEADDVVSTIETTLVAEDVPPTDPAPEAIDTTFVNVASPSNPADPDPWQAPSIPEPTSTSAEPVAETRSLAQAAAATWSGSLAELPHPPAPQNSNTAIAFVDQLFEGTAEELDQASEPTFDNIVDQFIEYDVGRLRGKAGEDARRAFEQLGPEALPALVRGLNRSAEIRASCPVVVISHKLEQTLQQTDDQVMIDYVLQNIGRDVPSGAPHAARIRSLREKLVKSLTSQQFNQAFSRVRPIRGEARSKWAARVRRLYHANADELTAALNNGQLAERAAAWAALSMEPGPKLEPEERTRLARLLLAQWSQYQSTYLPRIHDALTSLAKGLAVPDGLPKFQRRQTANTLLRWQRWWSEHGAVDREAAAAELLRLAKFTDSRSAQRLLARAVEKFPDTSNATVARHMLVPDAKLALARSLESQRRWAEAIELYDELAEQVDSDEGAAARQRLEVLAPFREPR